MIESWYSRMPISNPVLVLAITLLVILLSPLLYRKFKIPGVIGLIISGIFMGPHALKIISNTSSFDFFSKTKESGIYFKNVELVYATPEISLLTLITF